jgi:hypothetical protein
MTKKIYIIRLRNETKPIWTVVATATDNCEQFDDSVYTRRWLTINTPVKYTSNKKTARDIANKLGIEEYHSDYNISEINNKASLDGFESNCGVLVYSGEPVRFFSSVGDWVLVDE